MFVPVLPLVSEFAYDFSAAFGHVGKHQQQQQQQAEGKDCTDGNYCEAALVGSSIQQFCDDAEFVGSSNHSSSVKKEKQKKKPKDDAAFAILGSPNDSNWGNERRLVLAACMKSMQKRSWAKPCPG
eukprot:5437011-Prorocentrum_lima.AAC.1